MATLLRGLLLYVVTLLLIVPLSVAQPAVTNVQTATTSGAYSSITIPNLVVSGASPGVAVCVVDEGDLNLTFSSASFDGAQALTQIRTTTAGGNREAAIWYLGGAATTTGNVVVNLSGTQANGAILATAIALSGVTTGTPTLNNGATCGGCDTINTSITTTSANTLLMTCLQTTSQTRNCSSHGAGQTERSDFVQAGGAGGSTCTSTEVLATPGAETLTSNIGGGTTNLVYSAIGIEPASGGPPAPPVGFKYDPRNEFTDEFIGTHLNYEKWMDRVDIFFGNQPAYWERNNVSVSGGTLKIQTKFETPANAPPGLGYQDFTAGVVMSRALAPYGYYEVRAKAQDSRSSSAFWFFGFTVTNTVAMEIDVYEIGGGSPGHEDLMHINLHNTDNPSDPVSFDHDTNLDLPSDFHTYGVDWRSDTIRFYFDGAEVFSTTNDYWTSPLNLLMDTETLTAWFGTPLEANLPSTHEIDYVRGWALVPDTDPDTTLDPSLPALDWTNLATTQSIGNGWDGGFDTAPPFPASEVIKVVDHDAGTTLLGTGTQIQMFIDLGKLTPIDQVRVQGLAGNIIKVFYGATGPFSSVFPGAGFHLVTDTSFQVFNGGGLMARYFVFIAENNTEPFPGITDIEITQGVASSSTRRRQPARSFK